MIPSNISRAHIMRAIHDIERSRIPRGRKSRRFQLVIDGQAFPPKYVVSLANKYANGVELAPSKFNGGAETNSFLRNLGFNIEEISLLKQHSKSKSTDNAISRQARVGSDPGAQKQALLNLLELRFGVVKTEASFDWLVVPDWSSMDSAVMKIAEALAEYRGYREFFSPGIHLNPDYFIPSQKIIIEYDERQHFTIPRAIALSNYPAGLRLGYDKSAWISACETTKATDRDPEYRDEQRAFYDSLRDILAIRNGINLVRIKHGHYDWSSEAGAKAIGRLLLTDQHSTVYSISNDNGVEEMSQYYADLQKTYREWAEQFRNHEEVIQWLTVNEIKEREKVREQASFNLLSSDWNPVTIPVLHKVASATLEQMRSAFDRLINNQMEAGVDTIWYLLFFIHPIRHELYYFDGHFLEPPYKGYYSRLARLLRSHRQGLRAGKTYFSGKAREAVSNSFLKACSTVAFRHIHLHPTTNQWQVSGINDICAAMRGLQIGEDDLSPPEKGVAMALCRRASYGFDQWIRYAPCAINEGPVFSLKQGKRLSECFEETVQILQSGRVSQSLLRDVLSSYHDVEE